VSHDLTDALWYRFDFGGIKGLFEDEDDDEYEDDDGDEKGPLLISTMFMKHTLSRSIVFGKGFIMPMLVPASVSARFRCKLL
jgi:hypothetical protein